MRGWQLPPELAAERAAETAEQPPRSGGVLGRGAVRKLAVDYALATTEGQAMLVDAAERLHAQLEVETLCSRWEHRQIVDLDLPETRPREINNLDGSLQLRTGGVGLQRKDRLEFSLLNPEDMRRFTLEALYMGHANKIVPTTQGAIFGTGPMMQMTIHETGNPTKRVGGDYEGTLATRGTTKRASSFVVNTGVSTSERVRALPVVRRFGANGAVAQRVQAMDKARGQFTYEDIDEVALYPGTELLVVPHVPTEVQTDSGSQEAYKAQQPLGTGCWVTSVTLRRHRPPMAAGTFAEATANTRMPVLYNGARLGVGNVVEVTQTAPEPQYQEGEGENNA